jgi:hypothetical protein
VNGAIAADQEEAGARTGPVEDACQSVADSRQHIDDQVPVLGAAIGVLAHCGLDRDIAGVLEATAIRDRRADLVEKAMCTKFGWRGRHPSHGTFAPW